jgi:hypothetical protein
MELSLSRDDVLTGKGDPRHGEHAPYAPSIPAGQTKVPGVSQSSPYGGPSLETRSTASFWFGEQVAHGFASDRAGFGAPSGFAGGPPSSGFYLKLDSVIP